MQQQRSDDGHEQRVTPEAGRLDELMLAMDVVDTLRHQQDLVEHALAQDARDAALTARVREIYANQGIEVSDAVIAEGVDALKKDRFVYRPPAPSWRLRLARLYVRRGTWTRRVLGVGALGVAGWLVHDIQGERVERGRDAEVRERIALVEQRIDGATTRLAASQREAQATMVPPQLAVPGQRLRASAEAEHGRAAQSIQQARDRIAGLPVNLAGEEPAALDRVLQPLSAPLDEAEQALSRAATNLGELRQLGAHHDTLQRLRTRLLGLDLVPAAASELRQLSGQAEQALAAGDLSAAGARLERLERLADQVDLSYELRIVSRPDEQTGVWRNPVDNPQARNYYLIVDAIGADGRPLSLPITSEEDQSTRMVSTFGIRVPEHVFEAVRQDKMANGLVDDALLAVKRRGALEPEYRRPLAGGMITRW